LGLFFIADILYLLCNVAGIYLFWTTAGIFIGLTVVTVFSFYFPSLSTAFFELCILPKRFKE
jgi:hypothetical protein